MKNVKLIFFLITFLCTSVAHANVIGTSFNSYSSISGGTIKARDGQAIVLNGASVGIVNGKPTITITGGTDSAPSSLVTTVNALQTNLSSANYFTTLLAGQIDTSQLTATLNARLNGYDNSISDILNGIPNGQDLAASAQAAANAALQAQASANSANNSAIASGNSAGTAIGQATIATQQSAASAQSAQQAAGSSTSAGNSATAAQQSASAAATSANSAGNSATSAAASVVSANSTYNSTLISNYSGTFVDPLNELTNNPTASPVLSLSGSNYTSSIDSTSPIGGGRVLSVVGSPMMYSKRLIPYDPNKVYKLSITVRRITNSAIQNYIYPSYATVDASGNINNVFSVTGLVTSNGWQTYTTTISAGGYTSSTKYLVPWIQTNASVNDCVTYVAELAIYDITQSTLATSNASAAVTAANSAQTSANNAGSAATAAQQSATQAAASSSSASGYANTAQSASSSANAAANKYTAQYTIKVDANGMVAGIGLFSDSTLGSAIGILANKFYVTDPNNASNTAYPFVVQNGAVTIANAFIQNLNANQISFLDTTNGYIALSKISSNDYTNSGFWLGNAGGIAKLNIGNSISNLTWDGTNLNYTGLTQGYKTIYGHVLANGTAYMDGGYLFSVSKTGTGVYTITLSGSVNTPPIAQLTVGGPGQIVSPGMTAIYSTDGSYHILVYTYVGTIPTDAPFTISGRYY